ncbi:Hypothetical protein D9617_67g071790 [Elsinoe fawcettii]|nr:Hypothetical protein D9617_67g071790 [Elsinoe fawcettii]
MAILQEAAKEMTSGVESPSSASPIEQDHDERLLASIRAKVTKRVIPVVAVMYFLCFMDRINIVAVGDRAALEMRSKELVYAGYGIISELIKALDDAGE